MYTEPAVSSHHHSQVVEAPDKKVRITPTRVRNAQNDLAAARKRLDSLNDRLEELLYGKDESTSSIVSSLRVAQEETQNADRVLVATDARLRSVLDSVEELL